MAAVKIENAGRSPSALLKRCTEHAETLAKATLFTPAGQIETVQAMGESLQS